MYISHANISHAYLVPIYLVLTYTMHISCQHIPCISCAHLSCTNIPCISCADQCLLCPHILRLSCVDISHAYLVPTYTVPTYPMLTYPVHILCPHIPPPHRSVKRPKKAKIKDKIIQKAKFQGKSAFRTSAKKAPKSENPRLQFTLKKGKSTQRRSVKRPKKAKIKTKSPKKAKFQGKNG